MDYGSLSRVAQALDGSYAVDEPLEEDIHRLPTGSRASVLDREHAQAVRKGFQALNGGAESFVQAKRSLFPAYSCMKLQRCCLRLAQASLLFIQYAC